MLDFIEENPGEYLEMGKREKGNQAHKESLGKK